ncbi:site-2 protease family protein [Chthoniobacter flavus]|uniref:site-2 protease family protein n=1 Tax=Chthoniobacter flavus TaxID=191863 RepID=UPI001FB4CF2E|nr:site-2 protease family protein [Chthoniobacter flavus]
MSLATLGHVGQSAPMFTGRGKSLRLFRVSGVDVYVHWSWLFVALWQIENRSHVYSSLTSAAAEYLGLFAILLICAFGKVMATRQVGGRATGVLLWPLGCTTYVSSLPRRGAELWRAAAGPLVNVGLFLVFTALLWLDGIPLTAKSLPAVDDLDRLLRNLWFLNIVVLLFNLLPIYPLDGGRILRTLLLSFLSRARSLYVAVLCGFLATLALGYWALYRESIWIGVLAFYLFLTCRRNWERAKGLVVLERLPQRKELFCPSCHAHPPIGTHWRCQQCGTRIDAFAPPSECPQCKTVFPGTQCQYCQESHPIAAWAAGSPLTS